LTGSSMPPVLNPKVGTRQYPITGTSLIPGKGYDRRMDTIEIGKRIRDARELKGLSQEDVAEVVGGGQSSIGRIENGEWKRLPSALPAIVQLLGMKMEELDPEFAGVPPPGPGSFVSRVLGNEDFKVYASAEGGPGEIILSTDPIEVIPRPSVVANIREAYGLIITGTSMWPEYRHGETAIVNPLLPFQPNEVHIFYAEREGAARASIKELRRATPDNWLVSQHNPPEGKSKDFSMPRREWRWVHRVLGKYSRR
jgi:transcriptional regulator with XRE-family HTH domain